MARNHQAKHHERSKKPIKLGFIRLISGKWRGKKLPVINKEGLRPTTDRTKETLFNWLMHDIRDANCLDCFSGSGSLAFEALSRFANHALLLERDKTVSQQLQENLTALHIDNAQVIQTDSISYLQQTANQTFDVVFVDPPFNQNLVTPCCEALEKNGYLTDNALIYVEIESKATQVTLPANWKLLKEKSTGQVSYSLYTRA